MHFFIRCDSSYQIGSGHLMRCLTLAAELKALGQEITFICRNLVGSQHKLIMEKGFTMTLIPHHSEQQEDAAECTAIINKFTGPKVLIVDNYDLGREWEDSLNGSASIVVIDDLKREHHCDILIDNNYTKNGQNTYKNLVPST